MTNPRMLYFGPLYESGHFFHYEDGHSTSRDEVDGVPWKAHEIDGPLQHGAPDPSDRLQRRTRPTVEGEAAIHHKDGWTALTFWDYTIDKRGGSSSTYLSEGVFTFPQMVVLARQRFPKRWAMMRFEVKLVSEDD